MSSGEIRELKRLFDALRRVGYRQYKTQLGYLHALLEKTPRFRAIFDMLKASTGEFDTDAWVEERVFGARQQTLHEWPASEANKLRVLHRIFEVVAVQENLEPAAVGRIFEFKGDLDDDAQKITKHVVVPLMDFLLSRVETGSEILYKLERMRRQIEWFEQGPLYDAYRDNTSRGEDTYDRRVREFLFAEGIDYPFSQAASPAGKADVLAGLETDDPLVCEIKLYDGNSYGPSYVRKGIAQAVRYAHDYGKTSAHLVVFNLSEERLQLPTDEPTSTPPPRLQIEGVTVFMVVVQAKPLPSATRDARKVRNVLREQLVPTREDLLEAASVSSDPEASEA